MGCGDNSRKHNCGIKTQSICVYYKGYLPKYSKLDKDCVVIEETTEELYKNQEYILQSIDTSKLTDDCIDYKTTDVDGDEKILIVDVLQKMQDQLCNLQQDADEGDTLNLDFKCLTTSCGSQISTLKDLLQTLIDEICLLKGE